MPKSKDLKDAKHDAIGGDRHRPTPPGDDTAALWARELTTLRIADLFRTAPGLPGHWEQVQGAVNAGNRHFYDHGTTTDVGKDLMAWIADAIVAAAEAATFDFAMLQLQFTADTAWLKLRRERGVVIVTSRP